MNPYTHPRTEAEIAKVREWQAEGKRPFMGAWTPDDFNAAQTPPAYEIPDRSNAGFEIDWLILNRDFSW